MEKNLLSPVPQGSINSITLSVAGINALGPLEAQVMGQVWKMGGTVIVPDVQRAMKPTLAYTTVMTTMTNLWKKGMLAQDRGEKTYKYTPTMSREEYESRVVAAAIDAIFKEHRDAATQYVLEKYCTSIEAVKEKKPVPVRG